MKRAKAVHAWQKESSPPRTSPRFGYRTGRLVCGRFHCHDDPKERENNAIPIVRNGTRQRGHPTGKKCESARTNSTPQRATTTTRTTATRMPDPFARRVYFSDGWKHAPHGVALERKNVVVCFLSGKFVLRGETVLKIFFCFQ